MGDIMKYQSASQSPKHIVRQLPKLFQDHQLVTMSQEKSASLSADKFNLRYQLKNVTRYLSRCAKMFPKRLLIKYVKLLLRKRQHMAMVMVMEGMEITIKIQHSAETWIYVELIIYIMSGIEM